MTCLVENFNELELDVAIVAESWLKEGAAPNKDLTDLEHGEGIRVIHKSRKSQKGRNAGGGIAIVYNKSKIKLSNRPMPGCGKTELVCADGKLHDNKRTVIVYGVYVTPKLNADKRKIYSIHYLRTLTRLKMRCVNHLLSSAGIIIMLQSEG